MKVLDLTSEVKQTKRRTKDFLRQSLLSHEESFNIGAVVVCQNHHFHDRLCNVYVLCSTVEAYIFVLTFHN